MCGMMAPVLAAVGTSLVGSLIGNKSPDVQAPVVQQYTPDDSNTPLVTAPPAPTATPVMGQKSAEDMQKDASNDTLKKNKKGRAGLRIDRDQKLVTPGASGQVASGTVVPRG